MLNYFEIANQSDCLKHQDHCVSTVYSNNNDYYRYYYYRISVSTAGLCARQRHFKAFLKLGSFVVDCCENRSKSPLSTNESGF